MRPTAIRSQKRVACRAVQAVGMHHAPISVRVILINLVAGAAVEITTVALQGVPTIIVHGTSENPQRIDG